MTPVGNVPQQIDDLGPCHTFHQLFDARAHAFERPDLDEHGKEDVGALGP